MAERQSLPLVEKAKQGNVYWCPSHTNDPSKLTTHPLQLPSIDTHLAHSQAVKVNNVLGSKEALKAALSLSHKMTKKHFNDNRSC